MRLYHISGDEVVFLYDHTHSERPRVGDSYYIEEIGGQEAIIAQIVSLDSFNYPSLAEVLMRQIMEDSYGPGKVQTFAGPSNAPQVENLGQATAKIRRRRLKDGDWGIWNGWLPSRNVKVTRVSDEELLSKCGILTPKYALTLGSTLDGRPFAIEGRSFEKVKM